MRKSPKESLSWKKYLNSIVISVMIASGKTTIVKNLLFKSILELNLKDELQKALLD